MNKNFKDREDPYLLLDSSLISATIYDKPKLYDYKLVECGSFVQVYRYQYSRIKNINKNDDSDLNLKKIKFEVNTLKKEILHVVNYNVNVLLRQIWSIGKLL